MSKTLLLIGGTGIFGKSFIDSFIKKKLRKWNIKQLIVLSRNPKIIFKFFQKKNLKDIKFIKKDISKAKDLPFANYIIYCATSTNLSFSRVQLKSFEKKNLQSIKNFISIIKKEKFKDCKTLYTSSGIVYGRNKAKIKLTENSKNKFNKKEYNLNQISYYNIKKKSEKIIKKFKKKNTYFQISIARCFAFIGPFIPLNSYFIIGNLFNTTINKKKMTINLENSKKTYRSFLHTDDLINQLMNILKINSKKLKIFNVGSDEAISIYDLAIKFIKKFNSKIIFENKTDKNNIDFYVPNINRIKKNKLQGMKKLDQSIKQTRKLILKQKIKY